MLTSPKLNSIKQFLFYILLLYFTYLMVLITIQYIPINYQVAFLNIKQEQIVHLHYKIAFFIHVYSSIFVLFAGFTQFSKKIRNRFGFVHRVVGYIYVILILLLSAPSGFIMGIYANGGIGSKVSFCSLSILWFVFTTMALKKAFLGDFKVHRKYMLRSYALTLSAVSLRAWKWVITHFFETAPMDTYKIVAWLGWVLNLVIVEFYIQQKNEGIDKPSFV